MIKLKDVRDGSSGDPFRGQYFPREDRGCGAGFPLIIELTGDQSKVDAFISLLDKYEIVELARTGITALSRGMKGVQFF